MKITIWAKKTSVGKYRSKKSGIIPQSLLLQALLLPSALGNSKKQHVWPGGRAN